jgi:cellulose synthase/poly-beta-1,6-N-acetylglucosamine synthase-like glycosyltransferase
MEAGDGFAIRPRIAPADDEAAARFSEPGFSGQGCPELDCLHRYLPGSVLEMAEGRARAVGSGADRVLIAAGQIDEETYLRRLGQALGIGFEPLDGVARWQCPVSDQRLTELIGKGLLPLVVNDGVEACVKDPLVQHPVIIVVASRGLAARNLVRLIAQDPAAAKRLRLTSADRFNRFVMRHAGKIIAAQATDSLRQSRPLMSAASSDRFSHIAALASIAVLSLAAFAAAPATAMVVLELMLAAIFLAWLSLRLVGALIGRPTRPAAPEPPDAALPVYTVVAALYREARSVEGLLAAIERLEYPHEKLDVILAVEADDRDTRNAIDAARSRLPVTVIPVPALGPRTKPKALNVALPFARGTFTVVYDAEDRPDPDQLRCALRAFRAGGERLACVQARLCIDNTADSWLARYYTAEYAGQFDVFLPGLTALGLPLPLGGSSNHFRTATLRRVGAWDSYNVTEDADLGIRLARLGYRADIIDSTTYEEAPARTGSWVRQRTRWFKGWIQTWLVHMRQPRQLLGDLGPAGFLAFQLMVGGNVLAALVHPLFTIGLIYSIAGVGETWRSDSLAVAILGALYGSAAIIGYLSSAFLGWLGLVRRGLPGVTWVLALTPLHWLLLSLAAWRALYQFAVAPYSWEKTEHGLAKTSRRATRITRAMLVLERELRDLSNKGELAVIDEPGLDDAAPDDLNRRRPRRSTTAP